MILGARAKMLDALPPAVVQLAEAVAAGGPDEERRRVRALLVAMPASVSGGSVSFAFDGPVVRIVGLVDAALGDLAGAERALREAHDLSIRRHHAPWIAQIAYELGTILRRAGKEVEAHPFFEEAARIARELEMQGLEQSAGAVPPAPRANAATITKQGDVWRVALGTRAVSLRDSRGMVLLARLVERPGEEVHVLALASDEAGGMAETDAGDVLDERARAAYRRRLAELEEDVTEAERHADAGRLALLGREREMLEREVARAVGLGKRARRAGSATERARVNVQRRLKDAIDRVTAADGELGRFFERAVCTGTFCCFRPS
jgi:hypothetical protein